MAESFIVQDVKEKKSTKRTKQNKKYQYDNVLTADPSDTEGNYIIPPKGKKKSLEAAVLLHADTTMPYIIISRINHHIGTSI